MKKLNHHILSSDNTIPINVNLPKYSEPAQRYCQQRYEIVEEDNENDLWLTFKIVFTAKPAISKIPVAWATPQGWT